MSKNGLNTPTDTARPYQPIEGYEILARLGGGGMGTVFRARQIAMDRVVALKVLKSNLAKDEKYVERLHREARLLGVLDHPNIVKAYDVGDSNGYHYFVMEYVEGQSMAALLAEKGPLPSDLVLDVGIQMAKALEHSHRHDIIHRDIKPGNILLTEGGLAKLTDLGLAKRDIDPGLTRDEATVGTPQYISPEQLLAPKTVDGRSDIFSLGASLFHLLTGKPPFPGETLGQVVASVLAGRLTDPKSLRDDLDPGFASILVRMLQREPRDRYPDASALLADLEAVRAGRAPAPWTPPSPHRKRLLRWLAAAAAIVVLGVLGVIFWPDGSVREPVSELPSGEAAWSRLEVELRRASGPHQQLEILDGLGPIDDPALGERVLERMFAIESELRARYEEIAAELTRSKALPLLEGAARTLPGEDRLATSTYERLFAPRGPSAERLFQKEFQGRADLPKTGRAFGIWGDVLSKAQEDFESNHRLASISAFRQAFLQAVPAAERDFEERLESTGNGPASLELAQEKATQIVQGLEQARYGPALISLQDLPEDSVAELRGELDSLSRRLEALLQLRSRERVTELEQDLQSRYQEEIESLGDLDLGVSVESASAGFQDWIDRTEAGPLSLVLADERDSFRSKAEASLRALKKEFIADQQQRSDERFSRDVEADDNVVLRLLKQRDYDQARKQLEAFRRLYPRAEKEPEYWGLLVEAVETFVTEAFRQLHREVQKDNRQDVKSQNGIGSRYLISRVLPKDLSFEGGKLLKPDGPPTDSRTVGIQEIHVSDLLRWGREAGAQTPSEREPLRLLGEAVFLRAESEPAQALAALKILVRDEDGPVAEAAQRLHRRIERDVAEAALTRNELIDLALVKVGQVDQLRRAEDSLSLEKALDLIKELLSTRYQSLGLEQLEGLPDIRRSIQGRLDTVRHEEELGKPFHAPVRVINGSIDEIQVAYLFERPDELRDWDFDSEIWKLEGGRLRSRLPSGVKNLFGNRHGLRFPARDRRELRQFDLTDQRSSLEISFDYEVPPRVEPEFLGVSIYGLNVGIWSRDRKVWAWAGSMDQVSSSDGMKARAVSLSTDLIENWGVKYKVKISITPFGSDLVVALYVEEEDREIWSARVPRADLRGPNALPQIEIRSFEPAFLDNITLTGQLTRR